MFKLYRGHLTGIGKIAMAVVPMVAPLSARLFGRLGGEPAATVQTTAMALILASG